MNMKTRKIFMIVMLVFLGLSNMKGQITFQKTYGGSINDEANSVQQTTDGGYIIAGYSESFYGGNSNGYIIKTDSLGDTLWTRLFGGYTDVSSFNSIQQTIDGGYIITGNAGGGAGEADVDLIKINANGD